MTASGAITGDELEEDALEDGEVLPGTALLATGDRPVDGFMTGDAVPQQVQGADMVFYLAAPDVEADGETRERGV